MMTERILEQHYHSDFCDINIVESEPGVRYFRLIAFGKGDNKSMILAEVIMESALSQEQKNQLMEHFDLHAKFEK